MRTADRPTASGSRRPGPTLRAALHRLGALLLVSGLAPSVVRAHADQPPAPHDLASAWQLEPTIVLGLTAAGLLYGIGIRRLWSSAGPGRGVSRLRAAAFFTGLGALALALVSPLDALGEALFSAHMVQHLALILVAAPLLVAGAPRLALLWALPAAWRRRLGTGRVSGRLARIGGALVRPAVAFTLASVALWGWHLPGPYQAALESEAVHAAEHGGFLGTALLFWWVVIQPEGRRSLPRGAAILYLLAMAAQSSALGALLTFAPEPWFPVHAAWTEPWGLTPLEDQQLAGLVMWVPAGLVYLATMGWLFLDWLEESRPRRSLRPRRRAAPGSSGTAGSASR